MSSLLRTYASFTAHQKPTVGDMKMSAVNNDHLGWLVCDGRLLNVADWRALFNALGYQFGGSGTTFNLPNPAGRVLGNVGSGAGLTPRTLGTVVGTETHVLTVGEMPDHRHTITDPTHQHTYKFPAAQSAGTTAPTTNVAEDTIASASDQLTTAVATGITGTNYTGGTGSTESNQSLGAGVTASAHENMQPTLFVGNTFIYGGKPRFGTSALEYPPFGAYGGMPAII